MQIQNGLKKNFSTNPNFLIRKDVNKKEILLREGDVSNDLFFVEHGLLRLWHNTDGKDVTLQFFSENQMVSSFESFYLEIPSQFTLEAIENSVPIGLSKDNFEQLKAQNQDMQLQIIDYICRRFICYTNLFLSRIQHSSEQRYLELLRKHPNILERIPHHYIASYLGITPVSLSRIRNRIMEHHGSC